MILGEIIKDLRESKNYTQKELAKLLNITPACLSKYETGRSLPTPETLSQIADIFNVTVDYLLGRTSLKIDYETLKKPYAKSFNAFDLLNDMIELDSTNRKLLVDILERIKYYNDSMKITTKNNLFYFLLYNKDIWK